MFDLYSGSAIRLRHLYLPAGLTLTSRAPGKKPADSLLEVARANAGHVILALDHKGPRTGNEIGKVLRRSGDFIIAAGSH